MNPSRLLRAATVVVVPLVAWSFALATLTTLILHIGRHWPIGNETTSMLVAVDKDGGTITGLGFLYEGTAGALTLWTQALLVAAACALSFSRSLRLQRTGHIVLLLWNALWAANAIYFTAIGADDATRLYLPASILIIIALGCTAERARRCLTTQNAHANGSLETDAPSHPRTGPGQFS